MPRPGTPTAAVCALLLFAATSAGASADSHSAESSTETDVAGDPVRRSPSFVIDPNGDEAPALIGEIRHHVIEAEDTLWDVARRFDLGLNEIQEANPGVNVWVPEPGTRIELPTSWVLPRGERRGLVINIPEMRLYYFPKAEDGVATAMTHPVGLGRDDWQTPVGEFRVTEKTRNPTWVIPESIRQERLRTKGRTERAIPGGHPENPLGRFRIRLSLPQYLIHGTNIPWGVGMQVSHGCMRLYPEDIERLFPVVPVGTPGRIVYEPVKVGVRDGRIYLEVHRSIYAERFDYWNETRTLLGEAGWDDSVDWQRIAEVIDRKSGVPTPISAPGAVPGPGSGEEKPPDLIEARAENSR